MPKRFVSEYMPVAEEVLFNYKYKIGLMNREELLAIIGLILGELDSKAAYFQSQEARIEELEAMVRNISALVPCHQKRKSWQREM